jgi:choline kinase
VEYKKCDDEAMKVRSEGGKLVEITKQMPVEAAEGEFIGVASFRKEVLDVLKQKVKEVLADGDFASYFEGAIQRMIDETECDINPFDIGNAPWAEIDFKEDYDRAVALFG